MNIQDFLDSKIKDPSEDRDEFKLIIESTFRIRGKYFVARCVEALLLQDELELKDCKSAVNAVNEKIDDLLSKWDSAGSKEERQIIISKISRG